MANFSYEVLTVGGKRSKGSIASDNREAAIAELKNGGSTVIRCEESGALSKDIQLGFMDKKPKPRDLAVFCRQFVSIIDAGVPVVTAFDMLGKQTENKKLRAAILDCKKTIEHGETLAAAMGQHADVFPPMFVTLVEAGEASGSLDTSFRRMAEQFEKEAVLKATIKKATTYPVVIGCIAIAAVVLLLTFVIPTFEDMLADLGTELPGLTKFVIALSRFLGSYWYILLVVVLALIFGIKYYKKTDSGQRFFGNLAIKFFATKNLTVKSASAAMARTLSTLLGSGLPLMDALQITSGTMTNIWFKEQILKARDQVMVGSALSKQFEEGGLFPPMVYQMISIGEETGDIDGMLNKLAEYYEDEVQEATQQLMALLEPLIILFLAVMVGGIVLSVILPMASMYNGLNNL